MGLRKQQQMLEEVSLKSKNKKNKNNWNLQWRHMVGVANGKYEPLQDSETSVFLCKTESF